MQVQIVAIEKIIPYARNPRKNEAAIAKVAASLKEFGWKQPIVVDNEMVIIAGHTRLLAAQQLAMTYVPVLIAEDLTPVQVKAYRLADNRIAQEAEWDNELLALEIDELQGLNFDINLTGFSTEELESLSQISLDENETTENIGSGTGLSLQERFLVPPFSILDARQGYWQERKRYWLSLGIKSELGRGDNLTWQVDYDEYRDKEKAKSKFGKCLETGIGEKYGRKEMTGTSIFDPVLCEVAYRWFAPKDGVVLDPFAGGSVRGVVAALLSRQYIGIDLRDEQVKANQVQWDDISTKNNFAHTQEYSVPVWHTGDSRSIDKLAQDVKADFIFSCPPYADLEVYSDNPQDLSTLEYKEFLLAYREIIAKSVALLKQNRFACFVVGEIRNKKQGFYQNFVSDTINAFVDAGMRYYNEAILITAIGSLPVRVSRQFQTSRKLGKTHQNVLIFVKGDARLATQACGEIEIFEPELEDEEAIVV